MNIVSHVYRMRKRIKDKDLLRLKNIVQEEIDRRIKNDQATERSRFSPK
jgi:hypothetical protein